MIYRGPGFLAVVRFGSSLAPALPVSKLDPRLTGRLRKRDNVMRGEEGKGWARSRIILPQEVLYKVVKLRAMGKLGVGVEVCMCEIGRGCVNM
jgi:hypothetical protein